MKLLLLTLILFGNFTLLGARKPEYDTIIRQRVTEEYTKFDNTEELIKNYLTVNLEREESQSAKTKNFYKQELAKFREWSQSRKYEYRLASDRIAAVEILVIDELAGYHIRKQPIIFIKNEDKWTVPEDEIRQIYILDLDGDKQSDILYYNNCCGSEVIGAFLNRGENKPFAVNPVFWRRLAASLSDSTKSKLKPCPGDNRRYWPTYEPTKKTYETCNLFRIDFTVRHCNQQAKTYLGFDCKGQKFFFEQEPFE